MADREKAKEAALALFHLHRQYISRAAGNPLLPAPPTGQVKASGISATQKPRTTAVRKTCGNPSSSLLSAPRPGCERESLWNQVEDAERRKDSQVAREFDIALPVELDGEAQRQLIIDYVRERFVSRGLVADVAIHESARDAENENPHAHVMLPTREIGPEGFGAKVTDWSNERRALLEDREAWATIANAYLERAGEGARIDHRTLEEQGIDRAPQMHRGPRRTRQLRRELRAERALLDSANRLVEKYKEGSRGLGIRPSP